MCGIGGFFSREELRSDAARRGLARINEIQHHRGPDGEGTWVADSRRVGFAHTRLSILDLDHGQQPMHLENGNALVFNGEIYNFIELRQELGEAQFKTQSDTEVILRAYDRWGEDCVDHLRGMFSFALWDAAKEQLFFARDRFGIKPFYYFVQDDVFRFASEVKALLPFLKEPGISLAGLRDYFTFQFCLGSKTLFENIHQLEPAHCGTVKKDGSVNVRRYWEVHYNLDWDHTEKYFMEKVRETLKESIRLHLRSDVEVGAYVSGGVDSSLVGSLARELRSEGRFQAFVGKFSESDRFDESQYARALADQSRMDLHEQDITEQDFVDNIEKVIYHLDYPVAGPGSFPQFMVSGLVQKHLKVVLGGQGGDEIFGGYTRYLIAYFEQCIKGAIDGTIGNGNYVVTYESILESLASLRNYKPLIQEFWAKGIFDDRDKRYFRLINRSNTFDGAVNWEIFNGASSFDHFQQIYWGKNVGKEAYFDSMTHFDFKTLLPALLQVEDRMSMAHSVESRVPFIDHKVVELAATIPADTKFQNGELKRLLRHAFSDKLPEEILNRKDKMGFPVPLKSWMGHGGAFTELLLDTFRSQRAKERPYLNPGFDLDQMMANEGEYSRNLWAFLSLELWQKSLLDNHKVEEDLL